MCLAPILIKNPDFNTPIRDPTYYKLHNTTAPFIPVPCGRCSTCIHLRQMYFVQRVQMEALDNDLFFGTLTYNQESLPVSQYGDVRFAHVDFSDWQKMIKMIRKYHPEYKFKYMLVNEYGGRKKRPHMHFILSLPRTGDSLAEKCSTAYKLFNIFLKYWRRNKGSTRFPIWTNLCTYVRRGGKYNYDLHWLDPNSSKDGLDGVAFYVSKYVIKYDEWIDKFKSFLFFNLSEKDYKEAWKKFRPRCITSKGFGSPDSPSVIAHIRKGIDFALSYDGAYFPYFVSRINGSTYPLSPYYSKRFLTTDDKLVFASRCPDEMITEEDIYRFDQNSVKLDDMKSFLASQSSAFDFDDIDDINSLNLPSYEFNRNSQQSEDFATSWQDSFLDCDCDCDNRDAVLF